MWAPFKLKLPRRRPRSLFSFTPMMMHDRRGWFARHSGLVFLALTVFTFLQLGFHASNRFYSQPATPTSSSSSRWWTSLTSSSPYGPPVLKTHPIPQLIEDAESAYKKKLSKQSRTLKDAVVEYRKRYGRMPPKGFDKWFEMAMENKVVMTDEYDGMMSDLEPFWALSGLEVRRRAFQVGSLPSIDVVRVRDGKAKTVNLNKGFEDSEVGARAAGFRDMIGKVAHLLPDLDFPINAKAESRVIVPWEHTQHPNMTQQDSSVGVEEMLGGKFIADWHGDGGSVWESWRRTCPPNSTARRLFESIRTPFSVSLDSKNYLQIQSQRRDASSLPSSSSSSTLSASGSSPDSHYVPGLNEHGTGPDFSFTPSTAYSTLDFCSSPHAHYSQGHFFSDWRVIPALYPIFSPAKARGFSDIRIPSHYYYGATPRYTYGWDEVNLEFHRLPAKHPKVNALGDEGAAVVGDGLYGGEAGEGGEETVVMDPMDVPWEKKLDKVFWRGATTGGGNNPPGWMGGYQRHRFLRMASVGNVNVTEEDGEIVRTVVFPDPSSLDEQEKKVNTAYLSLPLSLSELNEEIMDVAFTKAVSAPAYPGGLDALLKDYRWSGSVALGHHWQYKYLLDLDGMSYSGRFLAFLESGSVPVKATVYDEWWAGWCVPWVHFIPLSTSYKEIYNIHAFFSGPPQVALKDLESASSSESESEQQDVTNPNTYTKNVYNADGDARLRRIARAGRQWKKTQGRRVDMELYVYRLALEWARLWADDRDAASLEI